MLGALVLIGPGVVAANATASPVGACCLPSGQCPSANQFDCDGQGGDLIGADTSCATSECARVAVGAPLLSIFGVVAATGAQTALGAYRLVLR